MSVSSRDLKFFLLAPNLPGRAARPAAFVPVAAKIYRLMWNRNDMAGTRRNIPVASRADVVLRRLIGLNEAGLGVIPEVMLRLLGQGLSPGYSTETSMATVAPGTVNPASSTLAKNCSITGSVAVLMNSI